MLYAPLFDAKICIYYIKWKYIKYNKINKKKEKKRINNVPVFKQLIT